jgi:hypothetical protein
VAQPLLEAPRIFLVLGLQVSQDPRLLRPARLLGCLPAADAGQGIFQVGGDPLQPLHLLLVGCVLLLQFGLAAWQAIQRQGEYVDEFPKDMT